MNRTKQFVVGFTLATLLLLAVGQTQTNTLDGGRIQNGTISLTKLATGVLSWANIGGKPTFGTASSRDVPSSGNATNGQVVLATDTRLTDARTPTVHTHTATDISDSTAAGRALLTAINAAAQRTAMGLGSAATMAGPSGAIVGTTDSQLLTNKELTNPVLYGSAVMEEQATTPNNPASGLARLYIKADGNVYARRSSGAEYLIGPGGGATITLSGAVTGSGTTAITTTLTDGTVTLSKLASGVLASANISDSTPAGRALLTAADAAAQRTALGLAPIATSGSAADLSAGTIPAARMPALTGAVTTTSGTVATSITANAVGTTQIANSAVTTAKMANLAGTTILGNSSASAAVPAALTAAQVRALLNLSTVVTNGSTGTANDANIVSTGQALFRWSGTSPLVLTGLIPQTTTAVVPLTITNAATSVLVLSPEDTASGANNRFRLVGAGLAPNQPLILLPNDAVQIVYDSTATRWIVVAVRSLLLGQARACLPGSGTSLESDGLVCASSFSGSATVTHPTPDNTSAATRVAYTLLSTGATAGAIAEFRASAAPSVHDAGGAWRLRWSATAVSANGNLFIGLGNSVSPLPSDFYSSQRNYLGFGYSTGGGANNFVLSADAIGTGQTGAVGAATGQIWEAVIYRAASATAATVVTYRLDAQITPTATALVTPTNLIPEAAALAVPRVFVTNRTDAANNAVRVYGLWVY